MLLTAGSVKAASVTIPIRVGPHDGHYCQSRSEEKQLPHGLPVVRRLCTADWSQSGSVAQGECGERSGRHFSTAILWRGFSSRAIAAGGASSKNGLRQLNIMIIPITNNTMNRRKNLGNDPPNAVSS
jgi:hypothetical protein